MLAPLLTLFLGTAILPAKPAHHVTDNAGVLAPAEAAALEKKLETFERQTSDQILVYIDRKVPEGTTVEAMGAEAMRAWGLGEKEKNSGAVLFVFTEDRTTRIEVGYGLEGSLTDDRSKLITSAIMTPRLQQGDYSGAVTHGVEAILNSVNRETFKASGRKVVAASAAASPRNNTAAAATVIVAAAFVVIVSAARRRARGSSS